MAKTTAVNTATGIKTKDANPWLGILPWIGVILFFANSIHLIFGPHTGDWQHELLMNGVIYMVGWAGFGAGIAHIFFGRHIARSIGFQNNAFELEVGFADLALGIVGLMVRSQDASFMLAVILASSIFRVGCGLGHIKQIIQDKNYAINNTAILFLNFVVPAFLLWAYYAWH